VGDQIRCTASLGDAVSEGTAHLETDTLAFRGTFRLAIGFKEISSASADDGTLSVRFRPAGGREEVAAFELGPRAERWAKAIREPRPLIDKLGVKPGMRVALVGVDDEGFRAQLAGRTPEVTAGAPRASGPAFDLIFLGASHRRSLARLAALQRRLKPNGALWVLRPKGSRDITEIEVLEAGRAAGLVDTKVVAFSATHTAEKFVIPLSRRAPAR